MDLAFVSVTVSDMDRAVDFYEEIFQKETESRNHRLAVFELENIKFSLWNATADEVEVDFGENCAPGFRTSDTEHEHQRISEITSEIEPIEQTEGYKIFPFHGF